MPDELIKYFESLTIDQQLYVLEIAYQALADPVMYEQIADILDLADSELMPLLASLHEHMGSAK